MTDSINQIIKLVFRVTDVFVLVSPATIWPLKDKCNKRNIELKRHVRLYNRWKLL